MPRHTLHNPASTLHVERVDALTLGLRDDTGVSVGVVTINPDLPAYRAMNITLTGSLYMEHRVRDALAACRAN